MKYYDLYIYLIIFFKIIFFILSIINIYLKIKNKKTTDNANNNTKQKIKNLVEYLRSRCEFIVTCLMSLLLIYIFNPLYPKLYLIDWETKYLLFVFGTILLLTAKWSNFFDTGNFFKLFQDFLN
jgi:hypothetical protein